MSRVEHVRTRNGGRRPRASLRSRAPRARLREHCRLRAVRTHSRVGASVPPASSARSRHRADTSVPARWGHALIRTEIRPQAPARHPATRRRIASDCRDLAASRVCRRAARGATTELRKRASDCRQRTRACGGDTRDPERRPQPPSRREGARRGRARSPRSGSAGRRPATSRTTDFTSAPQDPGLIAQRPHAGWAWRCEDAGSRDCVGQTRPGPTAASLAIDATGDDVTCAHGACRRRALP